MGICAITEASNVWLAGVGHDRMLYEGVLAGGVKGPLGRAW